jgi:RND family efflux transporter MFP subunit
MNRKPEKHSMNKRQLWGSALAGIVLVVALGGGYEQYVRAKSAASAQPAGPAAVSVGTVLAERRDFPIVLEANGTVTPLNTVEVHAQVASVVTKVHIREGQFVRAGEPMFTLDSRADQVNVTKAEAQLTKDRAPLADAKRQLERSKDLLHQNFVSQSAVDTNQAQVDAQLAAVAADKAAIEAARVALGYGRIEAPSAGRVGAISVFPGSYVQPGVTTLVTITQLDPIAVAFNLPQRNLPDALARLASGGVDVTAQLPGVPGQEGRLHGKLQFVDNAVDANSGTVKVKALFENKQQRLWPGAYVNVRFGIETLKNAVVVPQAAIIQGVNGKTLYIVPDDGRAALRDIEVLASAGTQAVVSGLSGGEKVVVEGRQNLRPGVPVVEQPLRRESLASTAPTPAGAASR